jgi:two-component system phosphate regulon sensor histidine kinase PhoR
MPRKHLLWQFYPSYLVITLIALVAVSWYFSRALRNFYLDHLADGLESRAYLAKEQISVALDANDNAGIDKICKTLGSASSTRITVVAFSGKVLGDSDENPAVMENHANRPEIREVLVSGKARGQSLRPSPTLGINMMYVAVPLKRQDETVGVVRTAIHATAIDVALKNIRTKILWGGLAVAICIAGLSLAISRRISQPIVEMKQIAQRFAKGELDLRVPMPASVELSDLAKALNEMATQLHDRILTITQQRNELEAVLSSMIEGVIAVDGQGRIVSVNKTAATLLNIDAQQAQGRNVEEVVRNTELHEFINKTLAGRQPTEADLPLPTEGDRFFQLHGASLPRSAGAVIVLNDMTRIRRLESLRRDFVANVSHELKTPVTSIQGFVEALLEGAMNDPKQAERFLKIIARHSDRLNSIIEDLLTLSRLEEDRERKETSFEVTELKPVLASAIELSSTKVEAKQMKIELICQDSTQAKINAALLEQAMINLIDNAIKYSSSGNTIRIIAEQKNNETTISVQDNGCGIAQEHIPRIFERFYVIDKGRSRKLGGTGLGLAIVKHIAQVHGGYVTVESSLGKGSAFTIHLSVE